MKLTSHKNNAIEVREISIEDVDPMKIKELLLHHEVVVFRKQPLNVLPFAKLCEQIGGGFGNINDFVWHQDGTIYSKSIPDLSAITWSGEDKDFPVQRVTGMKKVENRFHRGFSGIFPDGELNWHSSFNHPGLPDCVGLQAVQGAEGTVTSWVNFVHAYEEMPQELKERALNNYANYKYSPRNWAKGTPEVQLKIMENYGVGPYSMNLVQSNSAGVKGLYFSLFNECEIPGDPELYEDLKNFCFQEKFIYHHHWETGDIVLSDQVMALHMRQTLKKDVLENRVLHRITFYLSEISKDNGGPFYKQAKI